MSIQVDRRPNSAELGLPGLMELATGFQRAQVLFTAAELDVFGVLSTEPKSAADVATALGVPLRGVEALLDACVALRLVRRSGDRYENSHTTALFLSRTDMDFRAVLRFLQRFSYGPWAHLPNAVRENRPQSPDGTRDQDLFDWLTSQDERLRLFFSGLAGLAYWSARKLVTQIDLSRRSHLLDVGGGDGAVSEVLAARYPHLRITVFDRPAVCALAHERFSRLDAQGRLAVAPGDFHRDPLPPGADCMLLSNVLHDWSPDECRALIGKVHAALPAGGEVIVHDFLPPERGASREASLFELALVLDTKRGQVYTEQDVRGWLALAGFLRIRHVVVTPATGLLTGIRGE